MGTCLAVIKVIGISTLGLYTGAIATNVLSGYDILKFVLDKTATVSNIDTINRSIRSKLSLNTLIINLLGSVSSLAFQLAYFGAPPRGKHPYLIYSSLVFPLSYLIHFKFVRSEINKFYNLKASKSGSRTDEDDGKKKKRKLNKAEKQKKSNEQLRSDLDNSIYKDLGEASSIDENEESVEDLLGADKAEIEKEVEFHLHQQTGLKALEQSHFYDKIVFGLSSLGFLIASVGIYGDY